MFIMLIMEFQSIFEETMELQIEKLIEDYQHQANNQSADEIETQIQYYELAKAILDTPKRHPKVLHNQIKAKLQKRRLPFYTPAKILSRYSRLNTPEKRIEWVKLVCRIGENLGRFVQESSRNRDEYKVLHDNIRQVVFGKKRTPQMQPKAILFVFCSVLSDDVSYKLMLQEVIRIANFDQGESLLRDLIDLVAVERGLLQKRRARDQAISRIARTLVHLQSLGESDTLENENEQTTHEIEDLREAVAIAQQGLNSLQADIDKILEEAQQEASIAFFQEMNSVKHSYFLDQFLRADTQLEQFRKQATEIPKEIELISALIPIFTQFLRTYSIQPKEAVGEKITLSLKESDHYEYIGSDFKNIDELKSVEILASGWICEGRLIIKPRVREIG